MADNKPQTPPVANPGRKSRLVPTILVLMLMLVEGVSVFFVAKMLSSSPTPVSASQEPGQGPAPAGLPTDFAEIELAECRPVNKASGKLISLHIRVSALVNATELEHAKKLAETNKTRIEDRVNTVLRSADPKHLNEPGLETIKRRLKHELSVIFNDDKLVQEVLIPQMLQADAGS